MIALRLNFASVKRLHTAAEFSAVFANRRVLRGKHFDLHYRPRADAASGVEGSGGARLGLVIAKKFARRAVMRNLLKRVGREAFRQAWEDLPAFDLILRLAKPLQSADRDVRLALRAEVDGLLARLKGEPSR